jgi:hypothetical protein
MDNADAANETLEKKKKKKDKVRSAWISFAGRIVAQVVGAIATVALGVMVLHGYTSTDSQPPASDPLPAALARPGTQPIVIVMAPGSCAPASDGSATSAAQVVERLFLPR